MCFVFKNRHAHGPTHVTNHSHDLSHWQSYPPPAGNQTFIFFDKQTHLSLVLKTYRQMAMIFCEECGNLIDFSEGEGTTVVCSACGNTLPASEFTKYEAKSSRVNKARQQVQKKKAKEQEFAVVEHTCPNCGHPEMRFYTMQLRSADEGQTVFYECLKCSHKMSTNT